MIYARRADIVNDYHGAPVADPYRWLEDPASPETVAWTAAQDGATEAYLAALPGRERLRERLTELWDYPKYSVPTKRGRRLFYSKNSGLQNQAVLYAQDRPESAPRVVLDPNTLSADGTIALTNQAVSRDGALLAYGTSGSGSDWQELRVRRVDGEGAGTDYDETIRWCKFSSVAWRHDNSGFYYNRYPAPGTVAPEDENNYNRVYWHALGTPQENDVLVYERPGAKELGFDPSITDDGAYLLLHVWHGTDPRTRVYYRPLDTEDEGGPFVRLLDEGDALYHVVGTSGPVFYLHTDLDAPRGRIIAIDTRQPARAHWRELVPERDDVIDSVAMVNDRFVVVYMRDASHRVALYDRDGAPRGEVALPAPGSIVALSGEQGDTEVFLQFTSYLYPPTVFRYDMPSGALTTFRRSELAFDGADYETRDAFYTSKDGVRAHMFLTHRRGLALDGNNPTLLYGYGGFNISLTPAFSVPVLNWIERGGVYAVANLRGGAEYGEEWHRAGMLERKQNVFDDFIAAAEWLIASGYTGRGRLAISGGSNGGLLVGACVTQRPDLFGAAVCSVPVIDMLRYHRFTVGRYWIPEYGNAEADGEQFRYLYAYSPLHNVRDGVAYPPIIIPTADTDDRVVPAHAKKFAATLQAANGGPNPVLLRVEKRAGHGGGKPTSKAIDEAADVYAFLFDLFDMAP